MSKIKLRKGNLYNQLERKIDKNLLDSNQYDLELKIEGKKEYYRVRLVDSKFIAFPISLEKKDFFVPEFSQSTNVEEINSFLKTQFYKRDFPYQRALEQKARGMHAIQKGLPEYYYYLQRTMKKSNVLSNKEYDFSLPEIRVAGRKEGILSYHVKVECAANAYYLIFLKEQMMKDYYQGNEELYMIYSRKYFEEKRQEVKSDSKKISLEKTSPLILTELLYTITSGNEKLLDPLTKEIEQARRTRNFDLLLTSKSFQLLKAPLKYDEELLSEFSSYIDGKKKDIEYDFKKKVLKR